MRASYTDMTGRGVEDNASVTITTPDGAIGVIETGFVTPASPFSIEVQGTEGALLFDDAEQRMRLGTADGWEDLPIPADAPAPFDQWVEAIRTGVRTEENLSRARALTALTVAANAAATA